MPRFTSVLAATALAAGAIVTSATSAHATAVGPICKEVSQSGTSVAVVCVFADLRESTSPGVTVAPVIAFNCSFSSRPTCHEIFTSTSVGVGTTGFVPNPSFTPPLVDPVTGTVKVYAGTIGSIWIGGTEYPLAVDEFCVGDPTIC